MLVLAAWLGVSIPLAVATGRAIGGTATVRTYPPTSGPSDEVLRRLQHIELELEEVPLSSCHWKAGRTTPTCARSCAH